MCVAASALLPILYMTMRNCASALGDVARRSSLHSIDVLRPDVCQCLIDTRMHASSVNQSRIVNQLFMHSSLNSTGEVIMFTGCLSEWYGSQPTGHLVHPPGGRLPLQACGYLPSRRASPPFGWYSFYRPTEGRRLSRPEWLVTYTEIKCRPRESNRTRSPIAVLTGRAQRRSTSLIETNALPLHQTAWGATQPRFLPARAGRC